MVLIDSLALPETLTLTFQVKSEPISPYETIPPGMQSTLLSSIMAEFGRKGPTTGGDLLGRQLSRSTSF